jgi:toxin ParE1/3/4
MSYALNVRSTAKDDVLEAALWYEQQQPGLGTRFVEAVGQSVARLSEFPTIHRTRFRDVRRAPVTGFEIYGIFYLIAEAEVKIFAIHHGSRNPRWIRERRRNV